MNGLDPYRSGTVPEYRGDAPRKGRADMIMILSFFEKELQIAPLCGSAYEQRDLLARPYETGNAEATGLAG